MRRVMVALIGVVMLLGNAVAAVGQSDFDLGAGRQPQVCVDPTGNVFVVSAKNNAVHVNASVDGGKSFGESVLVENVSGLPVGMRRGPRIAATKDVIAVTFIAGERGGGKDGDIFAWTSVDQGKMWTKSVKPINSVAGSAREGMHGMAGGAEGTLACVWLDLRNAKLGKPGTEVWCATSRDGGKTWSQDRSVYRSRDGTVCECCHPSVVIDGKGVITVMFRNALAGARDMYIAISKDGGKTFSPASKLGSGSWNLNACPMDGGALAAQSGNITTLWRRDKTIYAAVPGKPEKPIAKGTQPVVAATADGLYFIWMDGNVLMLQAPGQVGQGPGQTPTVLSKSGSYPTIASAQDGKGPVIAVWEQDGKVAVRTIKAR